MSDTDTKGPQTGRPPRTPRRGGLTFKRFVLYTMIVLVALVVAAVLVPTTRWVDGSGYLMTDQEAEIRPSVEGVIQECVAHQGATVNEGDTLIQLRDSAQQLAYEQSLQELNAKRSRLEYVLSNQEILKKKNAEQIQQVQLRLQLGQDKLEKMRAAVAGAVSPAEINQAVLEVSLAQSQLNELQLPQDELMAKEAQVLRDEILAAQSLVARHHEAVLARKIVSPLSGQVYFHRFEIGEVVKPEHVLGQVFDTSSWVVKLKLPERKIMYIQPGQALEVELAAQTGLIRRPFKAVISRILPVVSPQATGDGVFYAEAIITDFRGLCPTPGVSARVRIDTGRTNWLFRIFDL
jgi:multidrug resistance efflux pump